MIVSTYAPPRRQYRGFGDEWWKIFTAPLDAIASGWATSNAANAATAQAQAQSNIQTAQAQLAITQAKAAKAEAITKYAVIGGVGILGLVIAGKVLLSRRAAARAAPAPVQGYRRRRRARR